MTARRRRRFRIRRILWLVTAVAALTVGSALADPPWAPEIGSPPTSKGKLVAPDDSLREGVGLATTNDGNGLWIADRGRNELRRFGPDVVNESYAIGGLGTRRGKLRHPSDVAVDPWGNLWVADTGNGRVQRLTPTGKPLTSVSVPGVIAVIAGDDGTVWALSTIGNMVIGLTSAGTRFASWQVRPPSSPTSVESTFLNNGGTVLGGTYTVTDITLGPTGNPIVSGAEQLRTRIDCSWYRDHRAQLVAPPGGFGLFEDDPVLEHGFVWEFTPQGLPVSSRRLTELTRPEACWTIWDTSASVRSVSATAGGSLYLTMNDNLYTTSLTRVDVPLIFLPRTVLGDAPRRVEASCRGDFLWTAGNAAGGYAASGGKDVCNRKPPGPGLAFGPLVPSKGGRSLKFSVACTIGRCRGTVDVVLDPKCRGCGGTIPTHPPLRIDLTGGKVVVVRFPYRQTKKNAPIGIRVVARVNGRRVGTIVPPVDLVSSAGLSLTCAAGTGSTASMSGRIVVREAASIPGSVLISLTRAGLPGVTVSLTPDAKTGAFSTSIPLPASGTWRARGSVVVGTTILARATCDVAIASNTRPTPPPPATPPPPPPPPPAAPPATSTITVSCVQSGDPATGAVQLTSSGVLTPARAGAKVTVTYSTPGVNPVVRSVTTGGNGSYADSFNTAPGSWAATAAFGGDATTSGSSAAAPCG